MSAVDFQGEDDTTARHERDRTFADCRQIARWWRRRTPGSGFWEHDGAATVELALVLPVFLACVLALFEFGHCFMITNMLSGAAREGARYGSTDGVTTSEVKTHVENIVKTALKTSNATITVKDAGVFDVSGTNASTVNPSALPNIEVSNAESGQLYLVRVTVNYGTVGLFKYGWLKNLTLVGQAVMRHE
jgi:Flp pilus assembly protein TadG